MNNTTTDQMTRAKFAEYNPFDERCTHDVRSASVWYVLQHLRGVICTRWPDQDPDQVLDAVRDPKYIDYVAELWDTIQPSYKIVIERYTDEVLSRVFTYMETLQQPKEES